MIGRTSAEPQLNAAGLASEHVAGAHPAPVERRVGATSAPPTRGLRRSRPSRMAAA
ncbi:hypothetical protein [Micromonospora sp. CPCC 206061]|uniref:hypothetical protein n=1 Tax=Micromonospora sp. CPCC 206061 TaxID=3122410 RepID=UPI002FF43D1C